MEKKEGEGNGRRREGKARDKEGKREGKREVKEKRLGREGEVKREE